MRALVVVSLWAVVAAPLGAAAPQVFEREVQVGERTVRALCTPGPNEALLLHADRGRAEEWRAVLERLDGAVGACAYDRGAAPEASRGWFELMDEMRRIHLALGFRGRYTLVGHSSAGLYVRLFAAGRPNDVAGLVLLDPVHEDMPDEVQTWVPRAAWNEWMLRRSSPNGDGVRESELAERARSSRLPDIPVTVITPMRRDDDVGFDQRFLSEAARRVHASILEGVTHGRHVPAGRSGHDVHLDEPELVAREIVRVVRLTRGSQQ